MKIYLTAYFATLVSFAAIDSVWLSTMADRLYRPTMGDMLTTDFRLAPAVAFYLVYIGGLTILAVLRGLRCGSIGTSVLYGAVVGFTSYATYDLTNQATLKNWSSTLTIADLFWGTILSATASGLGHWITARVSGSVAGTDLGPRL